MTHFRRGAASLGMLLALFLLLARPDALAIQNGRTHAGAAAQISINPSSAFAGATVSVNGANFWPGEKVSLGIGLTTLVTVTADAQGGLPATPITIPLGSFAGTHTVFALGHFSLRLATAPLVVLTARLHLQPGAALPGATVNVSGDSFGPTEVVRLSLDLTPLINAASDANGVLATTSITVPLTTAPGPHVVYAYGVTSQRLVTATLTVQQPRPQINLNATAYGVGREACVQGIGYGPNENVLVTVNGALVITGQADAAGRIDVCFAVPAAIVSGDNTLAVRGLQTGAAAITHFTGLPPIATTYYFAGGSTANGDTTDLPLLNTGALRARVTLTFYTRHAMLGQKVVALPAHTHATLHLASYVKAGNAVGVRVQSDQTITAQMIVHRKDKAPYTTPGATAPGNTWYLAEGYTGATFHEMLYILNPQSHDVTVQVQALSTNQERPRTLSYTVQARRIATLDLNRLYPRHTIGVVVHGSGGIVVTRVMTFGPHAYGANANVGTPALQNSWYFANGSVANGAQTYISVLNPSTFLKASVTVNMYDDNGQPLFLHTERVLPRQRASISLNNLLIGAGASDFDVVVSSTVPLAVERTMYYGDPNSQRVASSVVSGAQSPSATWSFASGDTTGGQHEYLTAYNPNTSPITVHATFYLDSGGTTTADVPLPAQGRVSVDATTVAADLPASLHGVQLTSSNLFAPFVAEQGIYTPDFKAGYSSSGAPQ